jgi:hypothetical protein
MQARRKAAPRVWRGSAFRSERANWPKVFAEAKLEWYRMLEALIEAELVYANEGRTLISLTPLLTW